MTQSRLPRLLSAVVLVVALAATVLVAPRQAEASDRFADVAASHLFHDNIDALAAAGVTQGCNPPDNTEFCPDDFVTRGQMAAFLDRALDLPTSSESFSDVPSSSVFAANIGALAGSGITRGCNPPDNTRFCPDDFVTRGQMAAFLDRALGLPAAAEAFTDVASSSVFAANIGALAGSGITRGCNPPDNTRFCPNDFVTRGQMAAFLDRAGLAAASPGAPTAAVPMPNSADRVADEDGGWVSPNVLAVVSRDGSNPTTVIASVTESGGVVQSHSPDFGIFAARYPTSEDAARAKTILPQLPTIEAASPYSAAPDGTTDIRPSDWSDDGPDATWTFDVAGMPATWEVVTGSSTTHVGVVDAGIYANHGDLREVTAETTRAAGSARANLKLYTHGTHVASTLCGDQNGTGLVGVMWDCRLHHLDIAVFTERHGWSATTLAPLISDWLSTRRNIRVINMSFTAGGAHQEVKECSTRPSTAETAAMRKLIRSYPDVLFVTSAGNCGEFDGSRSTSAGTPSNLSGEPNLVAVASHDGFGHDLLTCGPGYPECWFRLSPTSSGDFGPGVIAAPGGTMDRVSGGRVWAATHRCGLARCYDNFGSMSGTSMASPFVAGTAGLMVSYNPRIRASTVKACLFSQRDGQLRFAEYDGSPQFSVPVLDPLAAVACAGATGS